MSDGSCKAREKVETHTDARKSDGSFVLGTRRIGGARTRPRAPQCGRKKNLAGLLPLRRACARQNKRKSATNHASRRRGCLVFHFRLWAVAHFESPRRGASKKKEGKKRRARQERQGHKKERKKGAAGTQKNVGPTVAGVKIQSLIWPLGWVFIVSHNRKATSRPSPLPPPKGCRPMAQLVHGPRDAHGRGPPLCAFFSLAPFRVVDNAIWRARHVPTNGNKVCAPQRRIFQRAIRSVRFLLLCRRSTAGRGWGEA